MAQSDTKHVIIDPGPARKAVKATLAAAKDANRELARLEAAIAAGYGIDMEVHDGE